MSESFKIKFRLVTCTCSNWVSTMSKLTSHCTDLNSDSDNQLKRAETHKYRKCWNIGTKKFNRNLTCWCDLHNYSLNYSMFVWFVKVLLMKYNFHVLYRVHVWHSRIQSWKMAEIDHFLKGKVQEVNYTQLILNVSKNYEF